MRLLLIGGGTSTFPNHKVENIAKLIKHSNEIIHKKSEEKSQKILKKKLKQYPTYFNSTQTSNKSTNKYRLPVPSKMTLKQETFEFEDEKSNISIPATSLGSIQLSNNGHKAFKSSNSLSALPNNTLTISLPNQDVTTFTGKAIKASDNTIVYNDFEEDTDVAIQVFKDSVKIYTIINSAASASRYEYKVNIPLGGKMKKLKNGGVLILDKNKKPLGGFTPPWAVDAKGKEVPTHYKIKGNKLIQVVQHLSVNANYPVVADPYLGKDLTHSYRWIWMYNYRGYTMKVKPTDWARSFPGSYIIGMWGWDELYGWADGLNYNLGGMRDQFICHQQLATSKSTWNLDEYREDVGYFYTVRYRCNPPLAW